MDAMHLHATLPAGEIDLILSARGPAMYNKGTRLIPFLGGVSYYYSLPSLASQGTLTVNNRTYQVTGQSWLYPEAHVLLTHPQLGMSGRWAAQLAMTLRSALIAAWACARVVYRVRPSALALR